ncbi:hypothetical protein ACFYXH_10550 [Streptomyces sp. NPDC002730]|uniref:hypothetical protein n=1 Tax=Streptomyces sp. NPDC002730 TaxID=3364662 RepID=UPI00367FD9FC
MPKNLKSLARPAAVLMATGAIAGVMGVAPAAAAPAQATAVPSCITIKNTSSWATTTTRVTNNCRGTYRYYFKWDRHTDGPCETYRPGHWHSETVAITARFAGLGGC